MLIQETREAYFKVDYQTREESGEKIIEGYFIVHNQPTEIWHGFHEQIAFGACTKSIYNNDIRALYNHNRGIVLGRNKAGTLTLTEDAYGVKGIIVVNQNDSEAMNIYERIKRGDITGCSFGFYPKEEDYVYDERGDITSTVREADIHEISVCPFPAYPQTAVEVRQRSYNEDKKRILDLKKAQAKERLRDVIAGIKA